MESCVEGNVSIGSFPYTSTLVLHANASKLSFGKKAELFNDPLSPAPAKSKAAGKIDLRVPLDYVLFSGSSCLNTPHNVRCAFYPYYETDRKTGRVNRLQTRGDNPRQVEFKSVNFEDYERKQRGERASLGISGVCAATEHSIVSLGKELDGLNRLVSGSYHFAIQMVHTPAESDAMAEGNWKTFAVFDVRVAGYTETVYCWSGESATLQAPVGVAGVFMCRWIYRKLARKENASAALYALNRRRAAMRDAIEKRKLSQDMYFVKSMSKAKERALCLALVGCLQTHEGSIVHDTDAGSVSVYIHTDMPSWEEVASVMAIKGFPKRDFFHLVAEFCGNNRPLSMEKYALECGFLGKWMRSELSQTSSDSAVDLMFHKTTEEDTGVYALEVLENETNGQDKWVTLCVYRLVVMPAPEAYTLGVSVNGTRISVNVDRLQGLRQPVAVKWVYSPFGLGQELQFLTCMQDSHADEKNGPVSGCSDVHQLSAGAFPQSVSAGGNHVLIQPVVPQVDGTYVAMIKPTKPAKNQFDAIWDSRSVATDAPSAVTLEYKDAIPGIIAAILLAHFADGFKQDVFKMLKRYNGEHAGIVLPFLSAAYEDRNRVDEKEYQQRIGGVAEDYVPSRYQDNTLGNTVPGRVLAAVQQRTNAIQNFVKQVGISLVWKYGRYLETLASSVQGFKLDISKLVDAMVYSGQLFAAETPISTFFGHAANRIYIAAQKARKSTPVGKENMWADPFMLVSPVRVVLVNILSVPSTVVHNAVEFGSSLALNGTKFNFKPDSFKYLKNCTMTWSTPRQRNDTRGGSRGVVRLGDTLELDFVTEKDSGIYTLTVELDLNNSIKAVKYVFNVHYDITVIPLLSEENKLEMVHRIVSTPQNFLSAATFLHHIRMNQDIAKLPYTLQLASAYSRSAVYPDAWNYTKDLWDTHSAWCEAKHILKLAVETKVNLETRTSILHGLVVQASSKCVRARMVNDVCADSDVFYHLTMCVKADESARACSENEVDFRDLLKSANPNTYAQTMRSHTAETLLIALSNGKKDPNHARIIKNLTFESTRGIKYAAMQMLGKLRKLEHALEESGFKAHPHGMPNREKELEIMRRVVVEARDSGRSVERELNIIRSACSAEQKGTGSYNYVKLMKRLTLADLETLRFNPKNGHVDFWENFWTVTNPKNHDGVEFYTNVPHISNLRRFPDTQFIKNPSVCTETEDTNSSTKTKESKEPKDPEKPKDSEKPKDPEKPTEQEKPKDPEKLKEQEKPKDPGKSKAQNKTPETTTPKNPTGQGPIDFSVDNPSEKSTKQDVLAEPTKKDTSLNVNDLEAQVLSEQASGKNVNIPNSKTNSPQPVPNAGAKSFIGAKLTLDNGGNKQRKMRERLSLKEAFRGNHNTSSLSVDVQRFDDIANRSVSVENIANTESEAKAGLEEKSKDTKEKLDAQVKTEYKQYMEHLRARNQLMTGEQIVNFLNTPGYNGYVRGLLHRKMDYLISKCDREESCSKWRHALDMHKLKYAAIESALTCIKTGGFTRLGHAGLYLYSLYESAWSMSAKNMDALKSDVSALETIIASLEVPGGIGAKTTLDKWERTLEWIEDVYHSLNNVAADILELRETVPEEIMKWLAYLHAQANRLLPDDDTSEVEKEATHMVAELPKLIPIEKYAVTFDKTPEGKDALDRALASNESAANGAVEKLKAMKKSGGYSPEAIDSELAKIEKKDTDFKNNPLSEVLKDVDAMLKDPETFSVKNVEDDMPEKIDLVSPKTVHRIMREILPKKIPNYDSEPLKKLVIVSNANFRAEDTPNREFKLRVEGDVPDMQEIRDKRGGFESGVCVKLSIEYAVAGTPEHGILGEFCRKTDKYVCYSISDMFVMLGCKEERSFSGNKRKKGLKDSYVELQADEKKRNAVVEIYRAAFGEGKDIGDLVEYLSVLFDTQFITLTHKPGAHLDGVQQSKNRRSAISIFSMSKDSKDMEPGANVQTVALNALSALLTENHTKVILRLKDSATDEWDVFSVTSGKDKDGEDKRWWSLYSTGKIMSDEDMKQDVSKKLASSRYDVSLEAPMREEWFDTKFQALKEETERMKQKRNEAYTTLAEALKTK